jgi:hypothetical protein
MTPSRDFHDQWRTLLDESQLDDRERSALLALGLRLDAWPAPLPPAYDKLVIDLVRNELRILAPTLASAPRRSSLTMRHWLRSRWVIAAAILSTAGGGAAITGALAHALHRVESILAPSTQVARHPQATTTSTTNAASSGTPLGVATLTPAASEPSVDQYAHAEDGLAPADKNPGQVASASSGDAAEHVSTAATPAKPIEPSDGSPAASSVASDAGSEPSSQPAPGTQPSSDTHDSPDQGSSNDASSQQVSTPSSATSSQASGTQDASSDGTSTQANSSDGTSTQANSSDTSPNQDS